MPTDIWQVTNTMILQHAMGSWHRASLITQGSSALGEDTPRTIRIGNLK